MPTDQLQHHYLRKRIHDEEYGKHVQINPSFNQTWEWTVLGAFRLFFGLLRDRSDWAQWIWWLGKKLNIGSCIYAICVYSVIKLTEVTKLRKPARLSISLPHPSRCVLCRFERCALGSTLPFLEKQLDRGEGRSRSWGAAIKPTWWYCEFRTSSSLQYTVACSWTWMLKFNTE